MEFAPIILKQLVLECDISQADLAEQISGLVGRPVSRPTINLCLNRGQVPPTIDGFKGAVETALVANAKACAWLAARGLAVAAIWQTLGQDLRLEMPGGHGRRCSNGRRPPAMVPGNPEEIIIKWEVEMIGQDVLKHFKLFRNPFIDDIQKDADIYLSDEHRYIEATMLDAARHGGFIAVIGEVGSGKSVMRRKVVEQLKRDGDTMVIYPQMIDKTRLTAGSICDAIIQDVSSEKCRAKLEDKTRQVQRLLLDRSKSGYRACLIIEEAHDLSVNTLKYLKRFYELEDGYRKLLGIILIGQTELKHMFDEAQNVDMREVIRRVQTAEIGGLNGHLKDYLLVKFKRVGANLGDIFEEEAFAAMSRRLTSADRLGKKQVSHAYPLVVNNYTAKAMNLAYQMGEPRISADVVDAL
jgi:type II secretory pathway predicted ATPase ExeA